MTISRSLMLVILGSVVLVPSSATAQARAYGEATYALNRHERARNIEARDAAQALETVEAKERELAVHAAERRRLDALRVEADRLREEIAAGKTEQQPGTNTESLPENDYSSRLWNWFHAEKREPQAPASTRTREQIDERLRSNGVTVEIDGERITQPCQSLAQLEVRIEEERKKLDDLEKQTRERIRDETANALKHEENVRKLNRVLQGLESKVSEAESNPTDETSDLSIAATEKLGEILATSRSLHGQSTANSDRPRGSGPRSDCSQLFHAILNEVSWPSAPSRPAASFQGKSGDVKSLLSDLGNDKMSAAEYDREVAAPEQGGAPIIDDATRRQAAAINQQVAQRERDMKEAERRYQQAVRQQAQQAQIQRAWAEQQASRQQWLQAMQQQQAMQQFGNGFGNLFGGSGAAAPAFANPSSRGSYAPNRTRPANDGRSGSRKPSSSRVKSSQRQNSSAQGFNDMFSPVTDPNRAQQLQNTFGNKNRR